MKTEKVKHKIFSQMVVKNADLPWYKANNILGSSWIFPLCLIGNQISNCQFSIAMLVCQDVVDDDTVSLWQNTQEQIVICD